MGELYWDSTFEIVVALMEAYPDINLDEMGMEQLYQLVIALPKFADEPKMVNEVILRHILREWYEEKHR
jgi:FeS assembly protein IscX